MAVIRRLGPGDGAAMEELLALFSRAFDDPATYEAARPSEAYLTGLLCAPSFIALVAEEAGRIVGGLGAYVLPKFEQERREIYIYDLAVQESWRRHGVATALLQHLKALAARIGAYAIFVQADPEDAPAIALYTKFGRRQDVLHFDIDPAAHP